ncbi:MAG: class I SAM-dependent methyltransferase [Erysipelotrichaceae bacterium]
MSSNYYDVNAKQYYEKSIGTDMSALYERFERYLPRAASVLDAGCGVGRDSLHFLQRGMRVDAFDASQAMVSIARQVTHLDVQHHTFQQVSGHNRYDGIWACASLLHVPRLEMNEVMAKLSAVLKEDGVLYASFKKGEHDFEAEQRHFTAFTMSSLLEFLKSFPQLEILELWESGDALANRENVIWINVIVRKRMAG